MNKAKFEQIIKRILEKVVEVRMFTGGTSNKICLSEANSQLDILHGYLEGLLEGSENEEEN